MFFDNLKNGYRPSAIGMPSSALTLRAGLVKMPRIKSRAWLAAYGEFSLIGNSGCDKIEGFWHFVRVLSKLGQYVEGGQHVALRCHVRQPGALMLARSLGSHRSPRVDTFWRHHRRNEKRRGDCSSRRSLRLRAHPAGAALLDLEGDLFFLHGLAQLRQSTRFDLADSFLGHAEFLADFF